MSTINVVRYKESSVEQRTGYAGTIEPEVAEGAHPSWIIYFAEDGGGTLFTNREPDGTVIGGGIKLPAIANERVGLGELELMEMDATPGMSVTINIGRPA